MTPCPPESALTHTFRRFIKEHRLSHLDAESFREYVVRTDERALIDLQRLDALFHTWKLFHGTH